MERLVSRSDSIALSTCPARRGHEVGLLAIEIDRSLVPPRRRLAAAQQGAGDADDLACRRRQLDHPAVPEGQPVGGDEAEAAVVDVAGVNDPARVAGGIAEEAQVAADAVAGPLGLPALGAGGLGAGG